MHLAEAGRRGLTMILFLWQQIQPHCGVALPSRAIKYILQTPTLSRLLYPVREGTFLIGREDWASEGRVSQKKMDPWGWSNHNLKTVLRESEAVFS